ncbi:MAG: hypothetical protein GY760_03660 [Deltaproteobacteria bacterium]|nr:hypothetical protein [Deltaproteobacteria bacterium]
MGSEQYLTYRGNIKAITGSGSDLYFTTEHPEFTESNLYHLNVEKKRLNSFELPCAGLAVLLDSKSNIWVAGVDNHIYLCDGKTTKALGASLISRPVGLTLLSDKRVGVLLQNNILILSEKGDIFQDLSFPENSEIGLGTAITSDPSGNFFVIGTTTGYCAVYESEDKDSFELSESEKIHDGSVNALLFEKEELSFYSAGSDQAVKVTHARGRLEPLDRGKDVHEGRITSILMGKERFYTGSFDKTIKAWAKTGKPATQKDGVGKVVDLAMVTIEKHDHIVSAFTNNSIRVFPIDEAGRLNDHHLTFYDAYKEGERDLKQDKPADRLKALKKISAYDDNTALKIINKHIKSEGDPDVKLKSVNYLAGSKHKKAPDYLYEFLKDNDENLRMATFKGLLKLTGEDNIVTIEKALSAGRADIGVTAVKMLEKLAAKSDQLIVKLFNALQNKIHGVRVQALYSLENIYGKESVDASLKGLQSKFDDIRKLSLIRLYQRKLLDSIEVEAAIHKHCEDESADVRKIAFYLLIMTKTNLTKVLRSKDKNVHRQVYEIETYGAKETEKLPDVKETKVTLTQNDFEPLLFAMACRVVDTCLEGARLLAILNDTRAFGLLLQLSREDDVNTRVSVCQAFSVLNDLRAIRHLSNILNDEALEVRDAAFSALSSLYDNAYSVVMKSFSSNYEDVRKRGLQVLSDEIRKDSENVTDEAYDLLLMALNDSDPKLRSEAFKASLNLQVKGGNENTLNFINRSVHTDIRQEVFNEVKASEKEKWSETILFDFFNDSNKSLRTDAFEYSLKRKKSKEIDTLGAAISSEKVDIRLRTVEELIKISDDSIINILSQGINDRNYRVRKSVIDALVTINEKDTLIEALNSKYYDVRALAAKARAVFGDIEVLEPLKGLLSIEEPESDEIKDSFQLPERDITISSSEWKKLIELALAGLGELGDKTSVDLIKPFLKSKHNGIKQTAIKALSELCANDAKDLLLYALKDKDENVLFQASLGLAYLGDTSSTPVLFSKEGSVVRSLLPAYLLLGDACEDKLYSLLESSDKDVKKVTLLLLMLLELTSNEGSPEKCISCLSAKDETIRFETAKALKSYPENFKTFVNELFNDKGDKPSFTIPEEDILIVANVLANGERFTKLKLIKLLFLLSNKKQINWDKGFEIFKYRFKDEIGKLKELKTLELKTSREELLQLAFGSFVGLVREQGGYHGSDRTTPERSVIRIRQKALNILRVMGDDNNYYFEASKPVFLQTLRDPISEVRMRAFAHLKEMGLETAILGAEALGAGFMDIGAEGLKLLTEDGTKQEKEKILEQTMLTRDDGLELEASKILVDINGKLKTSKRIFESVSKKLQRTSVAWLSDLYDQEDSARDILISGFGTRFRDIYFSIAFLLATKKDKDAFKYLTVLLQDSKNDSEIKKIVKQMLELKDPDTSRVMLEKIMSDPDGMFDSILLDAIGNLRDEKKLDILLNLIKSRKNKRYVFNAILVISGFDQHIEDYTDENPDRSWEEKQFPRKTKILVDLSEICISLNETSFINQLLDGMRWARTNEVDGLLARLINYPDDDIKEKTVKSISFRLDKRDGPKDALVKMLESKETDLRFLAAEGLALAGQNEGISILLAAVDLLEEYDYRRRAVKALGLMADARAVDLLLKLAVDSEHALSEEAIEAIGHLGKTDKKDEVFVLLSKYVSGNDGISEKAVKGLRWLNTEDGWKHIRQKALDNDYYYRETAIEMLGFNNDDYTRDILLDLIKQDKDEYVIEKAVESARKQFGNESLEPDYAAVQCVDKWYDVKDSIKRINENGDPEKVLSLLHKCLDKTRTKLSSILLHAKPAPLNAAYETLSNTNEDSVAVAAHILGRDKNTDPKYADKIGSAVEFFFEKWKKTNLDYAVKKVKIKKLNSVTKCLAKLTWVAGRYDVASDYLLEAAVYPFDINFLDVQKAAVSSLNSTDDKVKEVLESVLINSNDEIRKIAASKLAEIEADAQIVISDRTSFMRLTGNKAPDKLIHDSASKSDYQGVVLPLLVKNNDIESLTSIMEDQNLDEEVRLGAIESLAQMKDEKAEGKLSSFADMEKDEDIKKAVFRALRRSKRARLKTA